jgi:hypothetical protein
MAGETPQERDERRERDRLLDKWLDEHQFDSVVDQDERDRLLREAGRAVAEEMARRRRS